MSYVNYFKRKKSYMKINSLKDILTFIINNFFNHVTDAFSIIFINISNIHLLLIILKEKNCI